MCITIEKITKVKTVYKVLVLYGNRLYTPLIGQEVEIGRTYKGDDMCWNVSRIGFNASVTNQLINGVRPIYGLSNKKVAKEYAITIYESLSKRKFIEDISVIIAKCTNLGKDNACIKGISKFYNRYSGSTFKSSVGVSAIKYNEIIYTKKVNWEE